MVWAHVMPDGQAQYTSPSLALPDAFAQRQDHITTFDAGRSTHWAATAPTTGCPLEVVHGDAPAGACPLALWP